MSISEFSELSGHACPSSVSYLMWLNVSLHVGTTSKPIVIYVSSTKRIPVYVVPVGFVNFFYI
jgi:hypothetical protein